LIRITDQIRNVVGAREVVSGRVRMGVTGVAALTWARALVQRMKHSHPDVCIELTVEASELLAEQIEEGQLDLAVLAGPVDSNKVTSERLGRVPMSWLASPGLDLPDRPLSPAEIAARPIISGLPGTYLHTAAMAWFRSDGVEVKRHHACSSLNVRIQLAAQGVGIALAAISAARRELSEGSLRLVEVDRPMPAIEYVIACPAFGTSAAVRIVAEAAKLLIAQKPDLESYYSAAERLIQWNADNRNVSVSIM
jgi:DNA-binding transcriptional LysR family regulator